MAKALPILTTVTIVLFQWCGFATSLSNLCQATELAQQNTVATCTSNSQTRCARRWLVNTRCLPTPSCNTRQATGWAAVPFQDNTATTEDLFAEEGPPIVVYVHGYQNTNERAFAKGELICQSISACCDGPVDFVLWSWPTEKQTGLLRDVRQKFTRADGEAAYFADFLSKLPQNRPRIVFGYSLGARVVLRGYHNQAMIFAGQGKVRKDYVALTAAATDYDSLSCHGCDRYALSQIERLLLLNNSRDPALKYYKLIERGQRMKALGYQGPSSDTPRWSICQVDLAAEVGRNHGLDNYFASPTFRYHMRKFVEEATTKPVVSTVTETSTE